MEQVRFRDIMGEILKLENILSISDLVLAVILVGRVIQSWKKFDSK